jgi:hypothetical protein
MDPVRKEAIGGGVDFSAKRARHREYHGVISGYARRTHEERRRHPEGKAACVHERFGG